MTTSIQSIRQSIATNVAQSHEIRARIHATKHRERDAAWNEKRRLGAGTRALLLALAFLRERVYATVESPATRNAPHAELIARVIDSDGGDVKAYVATVRAVEAWLKPAPAVVVQEAPVRVAEGVAA